MTSLFFNFHRSVTCSDSLLSSQVSNCLPQYSDSSPVFVSLFFFWLFVLVLLLLRRLICIACLLCFFSFFSHVLVFHLFWCDSSASSRLLVLLAGFFAFRCSKHEMNAESLSSSSSFWSYLIFGRLFAANIAFRFLTV